jgi:hypothetical protein
MQRRGKSFLVKNNVLAEVIRVMNSMIGKGFLLMKRVVAEEGGETTTVILEINISPVPARCNQNAISNLCRNKRNWVPQHSGVVPALSLKPGMLVVQGSKAGITGAPRGDGKGPFGASLLSGLAEAGPALFLASAANRARELLFRAPSTPSTASPGPSLYAFHPGM